MLGAECANMIYLYSVILPFVFVSRIVHNIQLMNRMCWASECLHIFEQYQTNG